MLAEVRELVGDDIEIADRDTGHRPRDPVRRPAGRRDGRRVSASYDPGAPVLPYLLSGGTDNKALSKLGITGYGFAPLQLPAELDFPGMFHGVDERVPLDALVFGRQVLAQTCCWTTDRERPHVGIHRRDHPRPRPGSDRVPADLLERAPAHRRRVPQRRRGPRRGLHRDHPARHRDRGGHLLLARHHPHHRRAGSGR